MQCTKLIKNSSLYVCSNLSIHDFLILWHTYSFITCLILFYQVLFALFGNVQNNINDTFVFVLLFFFQHLHRKSQQKLKLESQRKVLIFSLGLQIKKYQNTEQAKKLKTITIKNKQPSKNSKKLNCNISFSNKLHKRAKAG